MIFRKEGIHDNNFMKRERETFFRERERKNPKEDEASKRGETKKKKNEILIERKKDHS